MWFYCFYRIPCLSLNVTIFYLHMMYRVGLMAFVHFKIEGYLLTYLNERGLRVILLDENVRSLFQIQRPSDHFSYAKWQWLTCADVTLTVAEDASSHKSQVDDETLINDCWQIQRYHLVESFIGRVYDHKDFLQVADLCQGFQLERLCHSYHSLSQLLNSESTYAIWHGPQQSRIKVHSGLRWPDTWNKTETEQKKIVSGDRPETILCLFYFSTSHT